MKIDLKAKHLSLEEALKYARPGDVLYLDDITYYEKVNVETPNLTFVGNKNTHIAFGASHNAIIPTWLGGDGIEVFGTTGSATFTVKPSANGFKATGITFVNYYKRDNSPNGQAVAFKAECSDMVIDDCIFVGEQDTFYVDYGKNNVVKNSYIEGDIDFIFGSADCVFENCKIHALKNVNNVAYYTAPDTYVSNKEGLVFKNCIFTAEEGIEVYLGRPWFPSVSKEDVHPRIAFIGCEFPKNAHIYMKQMHEGDSTNYVFKIEDCKL